MPIELVASLPQVCCWEEHWATVVSVFDLELVRKQERQAWPTKVAITLEQSTFAKTRDHNEDNNHNSKYGKSC